MLTGSISGHFITLSSPLGSDGQTREMIALSLCVLVISECASFARFQYTLNMQPCLTGIPHLFLRYRFSDEMDPQVLDAIADFMNANKVSYQWKKVISLTWLFLFFQITVHRLKSIFLFSILMMQGDIFAINNRWDSVQYLMLRSTLSHLTPALLG